MTVHFTDWLSLLFRKTFELFTSAVVPGTNWSVFTVIVIAVFLRLTIGLLRMLFGFTFKSGFGFSSGSKNTGGNNQNIKISKDREDDTK